MYAYTRYTRTRLCHPDYLRLDDFLPTPDIDVLSMLYSSELRAICMLDILWIYFRNNLRYIPSSMYLLTKHKMEAYAPAVVYAAGVPSMHPSDAGQ